MSFDVYLEYPPCATCGCDGHSGGSFNLTHNVNTIVDRCLVAGGATKAKRDEAGYAERSWGRLDGWTGAEALPIVTAAVVAAHDVARLEEFKALEPENGWGSLESVQRCLTELLEMCATHPKARIRTSG